METLPYLFWSSVLLIIFYLFYSVLLRRETFFVLNRIYLLSALCLSIIIPLLDLSIFIELPKIEMLMSTITVVSDGKLASVAENKMGLLTNIYCAGVIFYAILLVIKLLSVKRQIRNPVKGSAFSFWRTKVIDKQLADYTIIDAHENIHIKQFHTLDMLMIEAIKVFFWFNPIIYYYRTSLALIHEYLADEHAASLTVSKQEYAMLLFLKSFNAQPALVNTFYNTSLLESRITMLQRKKSNAYVMWKYALCMPLIVLMVVMCSFTASDFSFDGKNKLDQSAIFPGEANAFSDYLIKNTHKVSPANGRVLVSFVVEKSGEVTYEKIITGLNEVSDAEVLRVIHSSPRWKPALQNGKKVRSSYSVWLDFKPENQTHILNNK